MPNYNKIIEITNNLIQNKMIWNPSVECMDRESMRKLQSERLRKVVERVYNNCEPYRKRMEEAGVTPEDINSIDDIVKLPFTSFSLIKPVSASNTFL